MTVRVLRMLGSYLPQNYIQAQFWSFLVGEDWELESLAQARQLSYIPNPLLWDSLAKLARLALNSPRFNFFTKFLGWWIGSWDFHHISYTKATAVNTEVQVRNTSSWCQSSGGREVGRVTTRACPLPVLCSHCVWTGATLLKWLQRRGLLHESAQKSKWFWHCGLEKGGLREPSGFAVRTELPQLSTPGGCKPSFQNLSKPEVLLLIPSTPHTNPSAYNFFTSIGKLWEQNNVFPTLAF